MKIKAFITHKKAERYSNCQDRFFISEDGLKIALSDGMTSNTLYPEIWAELLTKAYVESEGKWNDEILILCRKDWDRAVHNKLDERKAKGDRNLWRLENSIAMKQSAGATLCGICIDGDAKWIGHVIGDSTIIECKKCKIERVCSSEDKPFDNYPDYLDSISEGRGEIKEFNGSLDEETFLLLVSDPFSDFLDKHKENSTKYLKEILALEGHDDFIKLVEDWRLQGMHNDDSTLILIQTSSENNIICDDIEELINWEFNTKTLNISKSNSKIEQTVLVDNNVEKNTNKINVESLIDDFINYIKFLFRIKETNKIEKCRKTLKELFTNL